MILTDYYKGKRCTDKKTRFDVISSSGEYEYLENLLSNKRGFNRKGQSFSCSQRPDHWKGKVTDLALTKRSINITSIKRPDPLLLAGYGDINGTRDACIILFNEDYREVGINEIEIFIARGLRNDINPLWDLYLDGELDEEIITLRERAVTKSVTGS